MTVENVLTLDYDNSFPQSEEYISGTSSLIRYSHRLLGVDYELISTLKQPSPCLWKKQRHLSLFILSAFFLTKRLFFNSDGVLQNFYELVGYAKEYIHTCDMKTQVLHNNSTGESISVPYSNRFSHQYLKHTLTLLKQIEKSGVFHQGHYLTFTLPNGSGKSLFEMEKTLLGGWNKLRLNLQKTYGKFDYFLVVEFQKRAMPHLHILTTIKQKINVGWLRHLCTKYGMGTQLKSKHLTDVRCIHNYLGKYFRKQIYFNDDDQSENITLILLWSLRSRQFSCSRNLSLIVSQNNSNFLDFLGWVEYNDWVFIGTDPYYAIINEIKGEEIT